MRTNLIFSLKSDFTSPLALINKIRFSFRYSFKKNKKNPSNQILGISRKFFLEYSRKCNKGYLGLN